MRQEHLTSVFFSDRICNNHKNKHVQRFVLLIKQDKFMEGLCSVLSNITVI